MPTRQSRLDGIVLHVRNFGEAHRIYEVLTREEGRLAAVARNARTSRRRFSGALDLFATAELQLNAAPGLWRLNEARVREPRVGLRASLERLDCAAAVCAAARALVPEHQPAADVWRALSLALDLLAAGELARAAGFYAELLGATGILPDLEVCVRCGQRAGTAAALDGQLSGVVCQACAPHGRLLAPAVLAGLSGAGCADERTADSVESCALEWIAAQVGRPMRLRAVGRGRGDSP